MQYNFKPTLEKITERAQKRRSLMQALRDEGWTYKQIADKYGVTKQRVHQILNPSE